MITLFYLFIFLNFILKESSFFGEETGLNKAFEERIVKFWKFNSAVLNLSFQKDKFLKSACLLCENHLQSLSSKNIYMVNIDIYIYILF